MKLPFLIGFINMLIVRISSLARNKAYPTEINKKLISKLVSVIIIELTSKINTMHKYARQA